MKRNKLKQLETVAVDSVYCLSQNETWRYRLAEKLHSITNVRMYCNKKIVSSCFRLFYVLLFYRTCASGLNVACMSCVAE